MGNPTPTEQQLAAPSMPSRINPPGSHQFTVLKYGYNYVQDVSGGWISWPKQYDATTFLYYNKTTGVVDLGTCAQKCSEEDAPTGGKSLYIILTFKYCIVLVHGESGAGVDLTLRYCIFGDCYQIKCSPTQSNLISLSSPS